ncbi:Speckle-type POZ protein [Araneus ventricosus]|uniref:Speckle-type POZ protein n=1 Tax=Araneus ventricosus TaxID=182803 RepID=A0A4Y2KSR6_ARAVE|nr:Speckle-type POZ protein [Araneus ventricosus]
MSGNSSEGGFSNLKKLTAAFRNSSELTLKEKVLLRVGEETEAVLCTRSPVFAKMFENDMKELKENMVAVEDIKMPVLKALVSFLYTGKLPNYNFDFLCDLYYASDKYDIPELRQVCIDLLLPNILLENIFRALKLAFLHNIERFTVMTLMAANIGTLVSTNAWTNLITDEPEIAVEVLNFFDF